MGWVSIAFLLIIFPFSCLFAQVPTPQEQTAAWLETLQNPLPDGSDSSALEAALHEKAEALRNLGRCGTDAAIPAIEPFLADERLSTAARTALLNLGSNAKEQFAEQAEASERYHAGREEPPIPASKLTPESRRAELTGQIDSGDAPRQREALPLFALLEQPTVADLFSLWDKFSSIIIAAENAPAESASDESDAALLAAVKSAVDLLARRCPTPDDAAAEFQNRLENAKAPEKRAAVEPLALLDCAGSLALLERLARDADLSVVDRATERLGEWPNADAAPLLLELAKSHPTEKYRIRAFRGWLRLIRQMGGSPDERIAAAHSAENLPLRDEERKLLTDAIRQMESARKDRPLFNGQTLEGWQGAPDVFHVEEGVIVAGSLDRPNPRNEFLTTAERFRDFTLSLECKIEGEGGNAGVQFRSERVPNHHEMIGYQADMTTDGLFWGRLYDESRRNQFLVETDPALTASAYRPDAWNEYKIVCWGNRVKIFLNGILTVDYTEKEIPAEPGLIGLQIHAGPPSRALYRNIRIESYERF